MEKIWYNKIVIIVDKISMFSLDLLVTIDLYLNKAEVLYENLFEVLDLLPVIILLDDLFYFYSIIGKSL